MSRFDKLKEMNLSLGTKVVLSIEGGASIIHYTGEDYEGETVREIGIANSLANLVTSKHLVNNTAIEELRNAGYLDDYERGSYEFEEYVATAIAENWQELGLLEVDTKHHDHKRGYTSVRAEFETTFGQVLSADKESPYLISGWSVDIETPIGTLSVE
jgi:hypothetical protein